jgi:protein TonB
METLLLITTAFIGSIAATVYALKWYFSRQSEMAILTTGYVSPESVLFKKFPEADITLQRGLFLRIGFIFSLILMIIIFSLTFYYQPPVIVTYDDPFKDTFEIIDAPRTVRDEPAQQTPPPTVPKKIEQLITITVVDNPVDSKNDDKIKLSEIDASTKINTQTTAHVAMPDEEPIENMPFVLVEEKPEFPGGEKALLKYLSQCKMPDFCKEIQAEGMIQVGFTIDKTGQVTNVNIARSTERCYNEVALKHIQNMPQWKPGKQRGKPVNVTYSVPLRFRFND